MNASTQPKEGEESAVDDTGVKGLGRLTDLGLTENWQAALILPVSFEDFRNMQADGDGFDEGKSVVLTAEVRQNPKVSLGGKVPLTSVPLQLDDGTVVTAKWFGDTRQFKHLFQRGRSITVKGTLTQFDGRWQIAAPALVDSRWLGRSMPHYTGMGKRMGSETMRDRVIKLLREELETASGKCQEMLDDVASTEEIMEAIGAPAGVDAFDRLLVRTHCPVDPQTGRDALEAMERFAALVTIKGLMDSHEREAKARPALAIDLPMRLAQWKVTPSTSQINAVSKMQAVFSQPQVSTMLLSGDVGSGKTFAYITLVAGVIDAGGRAAILLPNESLAKQVQADLNSTFPDISTVLVTSDTKSTGSEAAVAIGTTALLSRPAGEFDLLVCDEQQKLGADQRRQLRSGTSHLLEVTATAIPRTMALAAFGMIETVHLREGHSKKEIKTRLWQKTEMRELFSGVRATIAEGGRILVVYPAIAKSKVAKPADANTPNAKATGSKPAGAKSLRSIEDAIAKWEAAFPGLVRIVNGQLKPEEKAANLADLKSGTARIGICTSVIEVGINIPQMRRVVVVHPERFGLTTLHQMRGRLAREGGHGQFDMLLMDEASENTAERLEVMVKTTDGYELAEADLRLRGPGELKINGTKQSGGAMSILYGREINPDHLTAMEPVVKRWVARRNEPERNHPSE